MVTFTPVYFPTISFCLNITLFCFATEGTLIQAISSAFTSVCGSIVRLAIGTWTGLTAPSIVDLYPQYKIIKIISTPIIVTVFLLVINLFGFFLT